MSLIHTPKRRFAVAGICLAVFAAIAYAVVSNLPLTAWDANVSAAVQDGRTPLLDRFFVFVTIAGNSLSLTLTATSIVAILLLHRLSRTAGITAAVVSLTPIIVVGIKATVQRTRPIADLYEGVERFSFPSGHMTNSTVIIGVLALLAASSLRGGRRTLIVGAMAAWIALVGVSRVYLGVHWPSDVIAGAMLAGVMLVGADWAYRNEPDRAALARAYMISVIAALVIGVAHAVYAWDGAIAKYIVPVAG